MSAASAIDVYGNYAFRSEYAALGPSTTRGAFAIIAGFVERQPAVLLGQRDSKGAQSYRHYWELPGGKVPDNGRGPREALQRRLKQEIGTLRRNVSMTLRQH